MCQARYLVFEPFYLDLVDERLWKQETSVSLGHKAFALLAQLISHPNQLVTKDDLLAAVWPETAVSEAVLTTAVREIRLAVGDRARTPRFVQTVHGRGYRFIAPVVELSERPPSLCYGATSPPSRSYGETSPEKRGIVGREAPSNRASDWRTMRISYAEGVGTAESHSVLGPC